MFFTKTLAASGLLAVANAHMLMKSPVPFSSQNSNAYGYNSPLLPDGSNFPCKYKGPDTYKEGEVNTYAQGSKQTLQTIGQAVHGGGSCQISITYDTAPSKDSVWKVIHSIEGGCPARDTIGNLGANPEAINPNTYEFTVPEDLPAGKGVVAWTWLNKIGNREFYMNCGAVEVTGSGGSKEAYNALPDMAVLNFASTETNAKDKDTKFANPGDSLENNLGADFYLQTGNGFGGGKATVAPEPSTTAAAAPSASAPGGVFVTIPTSAAAAPTSAPATSAVEAPTSVVASTPAAAPTGGSGSGSSGALTGPCTTEGTFNCIGGSSFQQCASGSWSAVIPMAAGTQCTAGQSTNMKIAAAKKRSARVFRA
ncbi:hypothetical protein MGN70_002310 [Eutypa lata]|uniref:Putative chitin-domain 3 protein n=1 Tax=Eutypa lata (strain UCR-EL1) TaxID=1287681 RepID=M7TT24_EUTLA|nr:putative chitin- domain 3 protein [Eutypa lata UCREL1]KAI1256149.1 hypothetical protein MGN70_002310 [Eutypa lata]